MLDSLQTIFSGQQISLDQIHTMVGDLKATHEPAFKKVLSSWNDMEAFNSDPSLKIKITNFIAADYVYFHDKAFIDAELTGLHTICNESWICVNNYLFDKFNSILQIQLRYK